MLPETGLMVTWFVAASSLVVLVYLLVGAGKGQVDERLGSLSGAGGRGQDRAGVRIRNPAARLVPSVTAAHTAVDEWTSRRMRQVERKQGLKERMTQAGFYSPMAVNAFRVLRLAMLVGPAGLGLAAAEMGLLSMTHGLLLGGTVGIAGTLAPSFWLDHVKRSRQTKIRRAMPDALDVLVVCLEGGLSLNGAFSRVARELSTAHPMLAVEFQIIERQTQMGRSTGEAVKEFADRFDLEELRSMASVIVQAERIGSSVVTALEVFADTLRQRRHQRAEEMAQKAAVKLLFPTLLCIFPGIFVVILGPAAIQIYEHIIHGVLRNSF